MQKLLSIALILIAFTSCRNSGTEKVESLEKKEFQEVKNDDYELLKPKTDLNGIVVLFGGYPERAEDIKREFQIAETAMKNNVAIVLMNYSRKLWLEESEKEALAEQLKNIFQKNELPDSNVYVGGFSSGGNVALLVSDYLIQHNSELIPKGVFVVDSPIDLAALYRSSEKNIERNFSESSIQESTWLIETLGKQFGTPDEGISNYERYAIYTSETDNFSNINNLKNTRIRFYSEPDTVWWKKNRMADFDQMNAFYLERLSRLLKKSDFKNVEYISTENRGYRANGDRHPHSWSIVDKDELMDWILE